MSDPMQVEIRKAVEADADAIAAIYNHYIMNTHITFETEALAAGEMATRIKAVADLELPWIVAETRDGVVGYAYASRWKQRKAYELTVESTIYVAAEAVGSGAGTPLYTALLERLRSSGKHSVIGGIALPNKSSVNFHERFGFEKVGHFERVGYKHDRWIDVGYWQLEL